MTKKKLFSCCLAAVLLFALGAAAVQLKEEPAAEHPPAVRFRSSGRSFEALSEGQWQTVQLAGVNMGLGYPGSFPNEFAISRETYLRWFGLIADMNANTIRVYQIQPPEFYSALEQFNETSPKKIWLIQGVDFPDQLMYSEKNVLHPDTVRDLYRVSRQTADALHGRLVDMDWQKGSLRIYDADVSRYLLGYTLGVEWDELFVEYTNRINPEAAPYRGSFFACTEDASPFESFLAGWGDEVLGYETEKYGTQPMISFANWADTDPLINEVQLTSSAKNRYVRKNIDNTVDVEKIRPTERNLSGMFAAYNIYPYFPIFLQFGPYAQYVDAQGNNNPYQGYLKELVNHHSCPVMISEFGIPSCRSTAYRDVWRDFSHGGLNEEEQGRAIAALHRDIVSAGCAGALVFSWQDEWFKRAWNEMEISDPDARSLWSNAQCVEQSFGLLAFDPGTPDTIVYPDGDLSEWRQEDRILSSDTTSLSMRSDERYVYFLVEGLDHRPGRSSINLALDVTPKTGMQQTDGRSFDRPVDFLIHIPAQGDGAMLVHAPYDLLIYTMGDKLRPRMSAYAVEELRKIYFPDFETEGYADQFHMITRARGSVAGIMQQRFEKEEAGILRRGNGNPNSPLYDSNADFCIRGDAVELRIPWQLLNFRDPAGKTIVDDISEHDSGIASLEINEIYVAPYFDDASQVSGFGRYPLRSWTEPKWHERLKPSYYILQEEFKGVN